MITFEDFSTRLALGQLKNTSAVDDENKQYIAPEHIETILSLTNQGLIDLSTKFKLITKQVDLVFQDDVHIYPLVKEAVGSYLDESVTEPFEDDFVKVIDIIDSEGYRHPHDTNGHIITPSYNTLRFTSSIKESLGEKVRIRYQCTYPEVTFTSDINIPPNLITALQLFVSSLYFSHLNGEEHTNKGDKYYATYMRHIGEDENRNNSSTSEIDLDTRFTDRGFV